VDLGLCFAVVGGLGLVDAMLDYHGRGFVLDADLREWGIIIYGDGEGYLIFVEDEEGTGFKGFDQLGFVLGDGVEGWMQGEQAEIMLGDLVQGDR